MALIFDGLAQYNLHLLTDETFKLTGLRQLALDARRADFEGVVSPRYDIFHIENRTDLLGDRFTIGVADAFGFVNGNADQSLASTAFDLHFDHFHAFGLGHPLGDLRDSG